MHENSSRKIASAKRNLNELTDIFGHVLQEHDVENVEKSSDEVKMMKSAMINSKDGL